MRSDRPVEEGGEVEAGGGGEGIKPREPDPEARFFEAEPDRKPERDRFWDHETPSEEGPSYRATPRPKPTQPQDPAPPVTPRPPASPGAVRPAEQEVPRAREEQATRSWRYPEETPSPPSRPTPSSLAAQPSRGTRRVVRTIRRFDPWSVLKFSLLFYFSVALVFVFAAMLLFFAAESVGVIEKTEAFIQGIGWPDWRIRPVQLFRGLILLGIVNVIIWSGLTLFIAVLHNLVSDVVGGVRVTMSERDI